MNARERVLLQVSHERDRQITKWGPQSHPDGTSALLFAQLRDMFRTICDEDAKVPDKDSWLNILREEVYEAFAEEDWPALRKELVQSAAVIVAWIEDGDKR